MLRQPHICRGRAAYSSTPQIVTLPRVVGITVVEPVFGTKLGRCYRRITEPGGPLNQRHPPRDRRRTIIDSRCIYAEAIAKAETTFPPRDTGNVEKLARCS